MLSRFPAVVWPRVPGLPSPACQIRIRPPPLDHRGNDPAMTLALTNGCDIVPYLGLLPGRGA
jgi:hypothetical protein